MGREEASGRGTHVYLWQIHFDIWQNQYNIVKLKKLNLKKKKKESACNAGDLGLLLGWEDLLDKEMATHSSILAWKIPWSKEPGRLQSMESQELDMI